MGSSTDLITGAMSTSFSHAYGIHSPVYLAVLIICDTIKVRRNLRHHRQVGAVNCTSWTRSARVFVLALISWYV